MGPPPSRLCNSTLAGPLRRCKSSNTVRPHSSRARSLSSLLPSSLAEGGQLALDPQCTALVSSPSCSSAGPPSPPTATPALLPGTLEPSSRGGPRELSRPVVGLMPAMLGALSRRVPWRLGASMHYGPQLCAHALLLLHTPKFIPIPGKQVRPKRETPEIHREGGVVGTGAPGVFRSCCKQTLTLRRGQDIRTAQSVASRNGPWPLLVTAMGLYSRCGLICVSWAPGGWGGPCLQGRPSCGDRLPSWGQQGLSGQLRIPAGLCRSPQVFF